MLLKGKFSILHAIILFVLLLFLVNFLIAFLVACLFYFLPRFLAERKTRLLEEQFKEQLLAGVELIAGSLRSGLSFQQTLAYLVKELPQPLAGEFKEVLDKIMLGVTVEKALLELSSRHKDNNLEVVVTSVIISRETGGNLAEVLSKVSDNMRENARLEGQIKTLTAQGKLSGVVIGVLPFLLLLFLCLLDGEMFLPMFSTNLGKAFMVLAILLEITGIFIIKKVTKIEL